MKESRLPALVCSLVMVCASGSVSRAQEGKIRIDKSRTYVIEKAGSILIDADGNDFGTTDSLHKWHAPRYIMFGEREQFLRPKAWQGKRDCSGRVVLRIDDKNLYVFAEVIDDEPMVQEGTEWQRDYVELFLSLVPHQFTHLDFVRGDYQVQILPGDGRQVGASIRIVSVVAQGKRRTSRARNAQIRAKKTMLDISGLSALGWKVEARIGLGNFPEFKQNNVGYLTFNVAVGDKDGSKFNKCYVAGDGDNSWESVKDYLFGYLYHERDIYHEGRTLKIARGPRNCLIPGQYLPDALKRRKVRIWDMHVATKRTSPGRESICLNGIWGVQTFAKEPTSLDDKAWRYLAVPLDPWPRNTWYVPYFEEQAGTLGKELAFAKDAKGQRYRVYYREFTVPKSWEGQRVLLSIAERGINVSCQVYLNGRLVSPPREDASGETDLTPHVRWDQGNELAVLARATGARKSSVLGALPLHLGDVWLHRGDARAFISACFVKTSVARKRLDIEFELHAQNDIKGLRVRTEILSCKSRNRDFAIPPTSLSECMKAKDCFEIGAEWKDPLLWSPEHPHLYIARLIIEDKARQVVDSLDQRFGFREVQIQGRELLVNGIPTHLRAINHGQWNPLLYEELVADKRHHYNCCVQFAFDVPTYVMNWMDELGMFLVPHVGGSHMGAAFQQHDRSECRRRWLMRERNHPSVAIWLANISTSGKQSAWAHLNYHAIGTRHFPDKGEIGRYTLEENRKTIEWLREADPTRPIMHYCAGNQEPIASTMNHADFGMPLQEAGAGAETWSRTRNAWPYLMLESWPMATGRNLDLWRGKYSKVHLNKQCDSRESADNNVLVEELSQYLGERAYLWAKPVRTYDIADWWELVATGPWDRPRATRVTLSGHWLIERPTLVEMALWGLGVREHARGDRGYGLTGRNWFARRWMLPNVRVTQSKGAKLTKSTIDHWYSPVNESRDIMKRLRDMLVSQRSLAVIPEYIEGTEELGTVPPLENPFQEWFEEATVPVLVYIGGGPRADQFRHKDHAYESGEQISKHVVAVNDTEGAITLNVRWELAKGRNPHKQGTLAVNVPAGRVQKAPFTFSAPEVTRRAVYVLRLTARHASKDNTYEDTFALEVYPRRAERTRLSVACFDVEGATTRLLRRLHVAVKPVKALSDIPNAGVFVIGRNSLNAFLAIDPPAGFVRRIEEGIRVIIMEQNLDSMLCPWLKEIRLRRQFVKIPDHPVLRGLTDTDFANWRGTSSLTESHPEFEPASEYMSYTQHQMFGKWGNEGIVCTLPLRRPQHGNARTLLAGGFDQEWAGLVEYHQGKGAVLVCQLDVSGRSVRDPVADRLVLRMIEYASSFRPVSYGAVCYLGGSKGKALLARLNAQLTADPASANLLIADAGPSEVARKQQWVKRLVAGQGRTMMVVWPDQSTDLSWIRRGIRITSVKDRYKQVYKAVLTEAEKHDSILLGVTTEDLYFKFQRGEIPLITHVPQGGTILAGGLLARIPVGKGTVIVNQLDPEQHEGERSFKKVLRCWSNLLTSQRVLLEHRLRFAPSPLELSQRQWRFSTDPQNQGLRKAWAKPEFDDTAWRMIRVGRSWESQGVTEENPHVTNPPNSSYNGHAWYRVGVTVPKLYLDADLYLEIAAVAGEDTAYFNGTKIGQTTRRTAGDPRNLHKCVRNYKIPADLIRDGRNMIAIQVSSPDGIGGLPKLPVRIMARDRPNVTPLLPMEKDRKLGDPYRFIMW